MITDQLNYRQSQIQDKQVAGTISSSTVRINSQIALKRGLRRLRERYPGARKLQWNRVLAGERRRYDLGSSSILTVIQVQRDTTTRALQEVDARSQYVKARTALDNVLGKTLEVQNVDIGEAAAGHHHARTGYDSGGSESPLRGGSC